MQRELDEKKRGDNAAIGGGAATAGRSDAELVERLSAVEATIQALLRSQSSSQQAAGGEVQPGLRTADAAEPPTVLPKPDARPRRPPQ